MTWTTARDRLHGGTVRQAPWMLINLAKYSGSPRIHFEMQRQRWHVRGVMADAPRG